MSEVQESEITLGIGRLLGLFFGLVVLCALFFSVGYSLGRKSGFAAQAAVEPPLAAPATVAAAGAPKPAPGKASDTTANCPTGEHCPPAAASSGSTSDELTFYKAVGQNDAKPQLEAAAQVSKPEPQKAPEIARPASLGPGYMVQVAAVTKQEDADALVNALRKKSYPVITTSNPPSDKLFHVQVGPFADLKDAEATRAKLISDGYNPILKK